MLSFYFQCLCQCVLINISHVNYMATGIYRTLMSDRFDPINISNGRRYAIFACQSRASVHLYIENWFITERLPIHLADIKTLSNSNCSQHA